MQLSKYKIIPLKRYPRYMSNELITQSLPIKFIYQVANVLIDQVASLRNINSSERVLRLVSLLYLGANFLYELCFLNHLSLHIHLDGPTFK